MPIFKQNRVSKSLLIRLRRVRSAARVTAQRPQPHQRAFAQAALTQN
jgi:hypothetical protein